MESVHWKTSVGGKGKKFGLHKLEAQQNTHSISLPVQYSAKQYVPTQAKNIFSRYSTHCIAFHRCCYKDTPTHRNEKNKH